MNLFSQYSNAVYIAVCVFFPPKTNRMGSSTRLSNNANCGLYMIVITISDGSSVLKTVPLMCAWREDNMGGYTHGGRKMLNCTVNSSPKGKVHFKDTVHRWYT